MTINGYSVTPIRRDPDVADELEEKIRKVPNFLPKSQSFWSVISQVGSSFFEVANAGVVGLVGTRYGRFAEAHITFWDGVLEDKVKLCSELADILLEANRLHFVLTYIPSHRKRLLRFAEDVGFVPLERLEGVTMLGFFKERL